MIDKPIKIYNTDNVPYTVIGELLERLSKKETYKKIPLSVDKYDGEFFSVKVIKKRTKEEYLIEGKFQNTKQQYNLYITQKKIDW